jgi:hypothetical protein
MVAAMKALLSAALTLAVVFGFGLAIADSKPAGQLKGDLLRGDWQGTLTMSTGEKNEDQPATMQFDGKGEVAVKVGPMAYKAKYKIQGKEIRFEPQQEGLPKMNLTSVTLTKEQLGGTFVPADKDSNLPPDLKLKLALKRRASQS